MVRAYICGHLCPDFLLEKFCPDIDAPQLSKKDCPIHNPNGKSLNRRRSSLSQPPMLARDEMTHEDTDKGIKSDEIVRSHNQDQPVTEDTGRMSTSERDLANEKGNDSAATADDYNDFHTAMAGAMIKAQIPSSEQEDQYVAARHRKTARLSFRTTELRTADHPDDCAVCSEDEEEAEDELREAINAAKPGMTARGCASDDDCSTCAEDLDSHVDFWDFAPEGPPQHFVD